MSRGKAGNFVRVADWNETGSSGSGFSASGKNISDFMIGHARKDRRDIDVRWNAGIDQG
ncbi:MAG: hypothetical protein IPF97_04670 [Sphingomonadales bacterium]|nr:hypothetical protein [Sphingomonadales bacterium]